MLRLRWIPRNPATCGNVAIRFVAAQLGVDLSEPDAARLAGRDDNGCRWLHCGMLRIDEILKALTNLSATCRLIDKFGEHLDDANWIIVYPGLWCRFTEIITSGRHRGAVYHTTAFVKDDSSGQFKQLVIGSYGHEIIHVNESRIHEIASIDGAIVIKVNLPRNSRPCDLPPSKITI